MDGEITMVVDELSPDDLDKLLSKEDLFKAWLVTQIIQIKKDIHQINGKYDRLEKIVYLILSVIATMVVYAIFNR